MAAMERLREISKKRRLISLILGQFLSLIITSTGFTSSQLARSGVNAPTSQSFLNYVLLGVVYGSVMLLKKRELKITSPPYRAYEATTLSYVVTGLEHFNHLFFRRMRTMFCGFFYMLYNIMQGMEGTFEAKWYFYVILGLVDVEANFLVVKAYQYTSLTSVMLLDCWTIPCVIILTWLFLRTEYGWRKFLGVAICVLGLVLVVFSDVHAKDRKDHGSNPLKGDLLVIAGATLYGVSNVSEEFLVKSADRVELMAMLGVFGAVTSAIQISILERNELKSIHWSAGAVLPFVGFAVAMFLFYSLVPVLLKTSGSTMLNLSLLTSDMWAVLIRIFAYHEKVDWLYFLAFAAVAVGLIIYSWGDKVEENSRTRRAEETAEGNKTLDHEAGVENSNQNIFTDRLRRAPNYDVEHKDEVVDPRQLLS